MPASDNRIYALDGAGWWTMLEGLLHQNRHVTWERYLDELFPSCDAARRVIPSGTSFYRARLMPPADDANKQLPFEPEHMGPPPAHYCTGGRLNPPGIPYLYGSLEPETAVSELRPWRGAALSVAEFQALSDLAVYDLTASAPNERDSFNLERLGVAFSTPVHKDDSSAYGATQFIAEHLKHHRDGDGSIAVGVVYPSAMRPSGKNAAFFGDGTSTYKDATYSYSYDSTPILRCVGSHLWTVGEVTVTTAPRK